MIELIVEGRRLTDPTRRLTDPAFVYTTAAATDVAKTWRKYGWKPIEEIKAEQAEKEQKEHHGD